MEEKMTMSYRSLTNGIGKFTKIVGFSLMVVAFFASLGVSNEEYAMFSILIGGIATGTLFVALGEIIQLLHKTLINQIANNG